MLPVIYCLVWLLLISKLCYKRKNLTATNNVKYCVFSLYFTIIIFSPYTNPDCETQHLMCCVFLQGSQ